MSTVKLILVMLFQCENAPSLRVMDLDIHSTNTNMKIEMLEIVGIPISFPRN